MGPPSSKESKLLLLLKFHWHFPAFVHNLSGLWPWLSKCYLHPEVAQTDLGQVGILIFHLSVEPTQWHILAIWNSLFFDFLEPLDDMIVLRECQSKGPVMHQGWSRGEVKEI